MIANLSLPPSIIRLTHIRTWVFLQQTISPNEFYSALQIRVRVLPEKPTYPCLLVLSD
jgi:hypothetical protein